MYEPLPLFDCVFCVKNSSQVVMGLLKHSLRQKYFERFLEQSNNNQLPVKLGNVDMTRYDADAVQAYFDSAVLQTSQMPKSSEPKDTNAFLKSTLFLNGMMAVPTKQVIDRAMVEYV